MSSSQSVHKIPDLFVDSVPVEWKDRFLSYCLEDFSVEGVEEKHRLPVGATKLKFQADPRKQKSVPGGGVSEFIHTQEARSVLHLSLVSNRTQ